MLCRRWASLRLACATVILLAVQSVSCQFNGILPLGISCKLIIPSMLTESGVEPVVRLIHSNSKETIYCTSPIVIRGSQGNHTNDTPLNTSDSLWESKESFIECMTYKKGTCVRTFHRFIHDIFDEIPVRLHTASIYPAGNNAIALISQAYCEPGNVQNNFCVWENETIVARPSSSLLNLLNQYVKVSEGKFIIGLIISENTLRLEQQISSSGPRITDYLTFNSSLKEAVSYNLFSTAPHLNILNILNLTLSQIPPKLLRGNSKLRSCIVVHCAVESVDPELFISNTELERVDFSNNRLQTLPGGLFRNNLQLRTLILARNQINYLPEDFVQENDNLTTLDLSYNQLQYLHLALLANPPETTYFNFTGVRPVPKSFGTRYREWLRDRTMVEKLINSTIKTNALSKIDISYNWLRKMPEGILDGSIILTIFRADHNGNLTFLGGSHSFYALLKVSLSNCKINAIDENFFAKRYDNNPLFVEEIDLSGNQLIYLQTKTFWNCKNLKILSLNRNMLTFLQGGLFKDLFDLRVLDVSENNLLKFQPKSFNLRFITYVKYSWNNIEKFLPEEMVRLFESFDGFEKRIDLANNCLTSKRITLPPLNDTRKLYIKYVTVQYTPLIPNDTVQDGDLFLVNIDDIRKASGGKFNYNNAQNRFKRLVLSMRIGPVEESVSLCPNPFKQFCAHFPPACGYVGDATTQAIDEISRHLNFSECKEVNVEDNSMNDSIGCPFTPRCSESHYRSIIRSVTGHYDKDSSFTCPITDSCPSSCTCYQRAIEQETVVNCSNRGLSQVPSYNPPGTKVLYFNHNELRELSGLSSSVWSDLSELYLENNFITSINELPVTPKYRLVSLKNNKIESIDKADLDILNGIEFFLSGNPWKCDCNTLFLKAKLSALNNVQDAKSVLCASSNASILNTPDGVLCPEKLTFALNVALAVSLGTILPLLAGFVIFLYYRNKELVAAYLFTYCPFIFRLSCSSRDLDADKTFDAFVSYSSSEKEVVMQMLEELEEKEPHFRLCIHERDWLPGNQITANIVKSVSSSRKTIVILSMDFVRSMWFPVELNAVYHRMVEGKENCAIIVIKGDIPPTNELDDHLQILLKSKTYLVWGERWFWEKLRYALYEKGSSAHPSNRKEPGRDFVQMEARPVVV